MSDAGGALVAFVIYLILFPLSLFLSIILGFGWTSAALFWGFVIDVVWTFSILVLISTDGDLSTIHPLVFVATFYAFLTIVWAIVALFIVLVSAFVGGLSVAAVPPLAVLLAVVFGGAGITELTLIVGVKLMDRKEGAK